MDRGILNAAMIWLAFACPIGHAQWVAYTFEPRVAYRSSWGMNLETPVSSSAVSGLGWPANWTNANLRGVLAIYFSTNTTSGNTIAILPPLIYTHNSTNTNILSTNNYTNIAVLAFTNTNVSGPNSMNDPTSFMGRMRYLSNSVYLNAVLSSISTDGTNCLTNISAILSSPCYGYSTNHLGTNGVPLGINYFPPILTLRLTTLSRSSNTEGYTNSQQLVLILNLSTNLTKIINNNTNTNYSNYCAAALTDPLAPIGALQTNAVYTNLPKLIRSNSTYLNL